VTDEEYQKEYDEAAAALDAAAQATTARGADGKFVKAEPEPEKAPEKTPEPTPEPKPEQPDPLADIRADLEATKKALKDTQAWGTKNAQEVARLKKESDERKRQAERPAILDANPELEAAIRHVVPQPAVEAVDAHAQWNAIVEAAHPGIFDKTIDPELEAALMKRLGALGQQVQDPLIAIREITAEKLAFTERQVGKRFAAESAKLAQKSAMSVPGAGAGSGVMTQPDKDLAEVQRIQNMSDKDFQAEVRRVRGL
jgi:hypothetical protein